MKWKNKISNIQQLGGIETSVLDNGAGKGVRIAWVNTGSGLRFKVVLDRCMDIADAFFNEKSLTWISHLGISASEKSINPMQQWLDLFGGGLLTTCGLSHIGTYEKDAFGERPLNGTINSQTAEIISITQPDPKQGKNEMEITGLIKESNPFGQRLELKRTISASLGEAKIRITDIITNTGNEITPHMILYHCNFGWPLIDKGTKLYWNGELKSRGTATDNEIFENQGYHICRAPSESNDTNGEACAFINTEADNEGMCICAIINTELNLSFQLKYRKDQLPWLTNWQRWVKNEYVVGMEPGTNPPLGQAKARKDGTLNFIKPGESRTYELLMEVITAPPESSDISAY